MGMSRSEAGKLGANKSTLIANKQKNDRIEAYNKEKKKCAHCQSDLEYNDRHKKFCNSRCSALISNRRRKKIVPCLMCEQPTKSKKKYCSAKCQQNYTKEQDLLIFLKGEHLEAGHARVRSLLIYKYGAKCMVCDWDKKNPATGKCPIELEHIDGNAKNNSLDNVKLLCPNCHSLTATYKALNKGNGRHKRKLRYQEGKSY